MTTREERRQDMDRRRDHILDTAAPAWRTRWRRRTLVVTTVLIVVATLVAAHLLATRPWWLLVGFLVGTLFFVALRVLTRGVAEKADGGLDEHDRALRDRAVRWALRWRRSRSS